MLYSGTDPESYITEYTLLYEDKQQWSENELGLIRLVGPERLRQR